MSRIEKFLLLLACVAALLSLFIYPLNSAGEGVVSSPRLQVFCGLALMIAAAGFALEETVLRYRLLAGIVVCAVSLYGAWALIGWLAASAAAGPGAGFWTACIAAWSLGWLGVEQLAAVVSRNRFIQLALRIAIPIVFGAWLLIIWELVTRGFRCRRCCYPRQVRLHSDLRTPLQLCGLISSRPF